MSSVGSEGVVVSEFSLSGVLVELFSSGCRETLIDSKQPVKERSSDKQRMNAEKRYSFFMQFPFYTYGILIGLIVFTKLYYNASCMVCQWIMKELIVELDVKKKMLPDEKNRKSVYKWLGV